MKKPGMRERGEWIRVGVSVATLSVVALGSSACTHLSSDWAANDGRQHRCSYAGTFGFTSDSARQHQEICERSLAAAGYLPEGAIGSTGIEELGFDGQRVVVARVLPGSPAERAQVLPGDAITHVDRQRVHDVAHAQSLIFGPAGRMMNIVVQRGSEAPRELSLPRVDGATFSEAADASAAPK